jgi:glycosyltransferase involved in cell wall biosynthesis
MGQTGVDWYVKAGYPSEKVFPYAYVVEAPTYFPPPATNDAVVRIAFVGALIKRKGVDLLIRALARLQEFPWHLDIVGNGPEFNALRRLAVHADIAERVQFHGTLPMSQVNARIAICDLLALPSRYDGWGAVVNEALMLGVPVICSDKCGAADLLRTTAQGATFTAGSVTSLANMLANRLNTGRITTNRREAVQMMAARVHGEQVARYLLAVLACVYQGKGRPIPPWHSERDDRVARESPCV